MKNINILSVLLICSFVSFGQSRKEVKKCKSLIKEAQFSIDEEDYHQAWILYKEVLKRDSTNEKAGVNAALCASALKYNIDSILFLVYNLSISSLPDSKFFLAKIRHSQEKFDEAISLLNSYQLVNEKERVLSNDEISYLNGSCINAKWFYANPSLSAIKNMGPTINSSFADYAPVIIPDESALYFTSKRAGSSHNLKNGDNNYFEDIYVSYFSNGTWLSAQNAGEPLNSETNDGCVAVSHDGQKMIVYRTSDIKISGNLFETQLGSDNKWEPLKLLGNSINSEFTETSACYSSDSTEFFFSSDRPGGFGGKDLYRIKKLPNGEWAMPYNLGSTINTKYDEDAPFLHPDGITLYFSSKGHNTMGAFDVFRSILNKENNMFGIAQNLGYPINSTGDDIFFVLSVDGQRAYYSSKKSETFGDIDIYEIETRFGENDLQVRTGHVFVDGHPDRVKISLAESGSNELQGIFYSNASTGKFIYILNPLKAYDLTAEASGCAPVTIKVESAAFSNIKNDLEIVLKSHDAQ